MMRWSVLVAGAIAVTCAAFVTGAAVPTKAEKAPEPVKAEAKPGIVLGQKTGYFNMAKVMREYKRAKTSVERLNAKRARMAANLTGLRNMYTELQTMAKRETDEKRKEEIAGDLIMLARRIEDTDRDINKILNERASLIIAELYDEIYAAVAAMAREHNLTAVLAYPDAVSKEEADNPFVKELKLKPPAAQPFYVDPSAEFSNELIRRLNEKFDENNN